MKSVFKKKKNCSALDRFTCVNITPGVLITGKVTCLNVSIQIVFWYLAWFLPGDFKNSVSEWKHLNYTSSSPQEVNFCLSATVLAILKYQYLVIADVISILFNLKYFDILHLRLAEVTYSFCIITRSKLSGDNYNFSWFFNIWQKLYSNGT